MYKRGLILLAVMWTAVFLGTFSALAQQVQNVTTVFAVGSSRIRGGDMSASHKEALDGSMVAAVTTVLTEIMPQETLVGHFQVLNKGILVRADQFVLDYKKMTESTHANYYRVMVRARVSVQRLKDAVKRAGIYLGRKKYPRVLYCIAEKKVNAVNFDYWWNVQGGWQSSVATESMAGLFRDKGFFVVDPGGSHAPRSYPPELSGPEAVALGRDFQADVVVVGQAVADGAPNTRGGSLLSFRGDIAAHAYRVDNGQLIAQARRSALSTAENPDIGGRDALRNTAAKVAEDLSRQIADAWFSQSAGTSQVTLEIEGVGGHIASFVKFRGALSTMSGVESMQLREMRQDAAVLTVDYQGNVRALADALMRQNFDSFGIQMADPEGDTIRMQLVPR